MALKSSEHSESLPVLAARPGTAPESSPQQKSPSLCSSRSPQQQMEFLFQILRLRLIEEKIAALYPQQAMRCPVHLSIGQEAVSVGICKNLKSEDIVLSNHRAHGHYLAKGGDLKVFFAELYGKATGCAAGRGGSMHLVDLNVNFWGSTPIVGGSIPVAVGVSLAQKMQATGGVVAAFFGDAACEEGVFHESLNFAVLKKLPILFVCENNLYSVYTPLKERQPPRDISALAEGHGLTCFREDGNDVLKVFETGRQALEAIRRQEGPCFVEFLTYRYLEHCGPNDDLALGYRFRQEWQEWKDKCPLARLKQRMEQEGLLSASVWARLQAEIENEIEEAVAFALKSPLAVGTLSEEAVYKKNPGAEREISFKTKNEKMIIGPARSLTYAQAIREATDFCLKNDERVFLIGEGVPDPKGIFGSTLGLRESYGPTRVMDMPVSENALTGVCIGAALSGWRPILTHQRVDFALLSLDQIINNAAKWYFMFGGQKSVPLVIRLIIGRGWGQGAQHSQSLQALFAHIPGLKVVMPATPYDMKGLLIAAVRDENPVICFEHRWLYGISGEVPALGYEVPLGQGIIRREGRDITLVAVSYMVLEALRAAEYLKEIGIEAEVLDLRTIQPWDKGLVKESVFKTGRLLVADTGTISFGVAAEIVASIAQEMFFNLKSAPVRIALADVPTPSSCGLTKDFYPTAKEIALNAAQMLGVATEKLQKVFEAQSSSGTPSDVPDPSFTGPF